MLDWRFTEIFRLYMTPTVIEDIDDPSTRGVESDSGNLKFAGEGFSPSEEEIRNNGGGR